MRKKILVIDDEAAIRKSFQLALEETHYQVDTVDSGMKGIEHHKVNQYDLIYLDLKMPGLNGVETLIKLREIDETVPIYIITAFFEEYFDELKIAEDRGLAFELMKKPIGMDEIVMVSKSILAGPIVH